MGPKRGKRRRYVIKTALQMRFVLGFSLVVSVGFLLNWVAVYFWIDRELGYELYKIHLKVSSTAHVVVPIFFKVGAITVPLILAAAVVIGYYLTMSVELPLAIFRRAMDSVKGGDLTVRLSSVAPEELSGHFNRMTEAIEVAFERITALIESIDVHARSIEMLMSGDIRLAKEKIESSLDAVGLLRQDMESEIEHLRA
ncbi:MAG: hypothetical protein HY880_03605 [Deltaproteobacteria bacterium]|nr:hypothetical protein [Deltaproteobacteria bacterium]